ncbi:MAG TPA: DsbA family protein [Patescibacteria group bacterium]
MSSKEIRAALAEKLLAPMVIVMIVLAFVVGVLWQKVDFLQKGTTATVAGTQTGTTATPAPAPTISLSQIKDLFGKDLIKFGDGNRKVLFAEISDPSCPYCHAAGGENHSIAQNLGPNFKLVSDGGTYVAPVSEMRKLVDSGQASFVWIYYPGHGNGEMGTKALYCANEKGKFWDVHDLLMSDKGYDLLNNTVKNDKTQSGALADFLKPAIDSNFLKGCLDSGKYDQRLGDDMTIAKSLNVQGTPGFFVNQNVFPGAYSYTDLKSTVDAALKS